MNFSEVARILREVAKTWDGLPIADNARMHLSDKDGYPVGMAGFVPD